MGPRIKPVTVMEFGIAHIMKCAHDCFEAQSMQRDARVSRPGKIVSIGHPRLVCVDCMVCVSLHSTPGFVVWG